MFDYKNHGIKDLICDDSFQRIILSQNPDDKRLLDLWLIENPDKKNTVEDARAILLYIANHYDLFDFSEKDKENTLEKIIEKLDLMTQEKEVPSISFFKTGWFRIAATIFISLCIGVIVYFNNVQFSAVSKFLTSETESKINLEFHKNTSGKQQLLTLSDGSSVLLQDQSSISFPVDFNTADRKVNLSGEAFFEIAKNKNKPFFIHANGLITKVSGTSFAIRAYKNDSVKVTVKTGKVTIYADDKEMDPSLQPETIDVVSDQQATFDENNVKVSISSVSNKELKEFTIQQQLFEFDKTPIPQVLSILEESYGIKMISEEEVVNNRTITASLNDKPFIKKIDLICELIDAAYEQKDNLIIITSN